MIGGWRGLTLVIQFNPGKPRDALVLLPKSYLQWEIAGSKQKPPLLDAPIHYHVFISIAIALKYIFFCYPLITTFSNSSN